MNTSDLAERSIAPADPYLAIRRRDAAFVGAFVMGVKTTGIFCRPGCPARTPRREHCQFFATPAEALRAGFRPCQRCRPLSPAPSAPAWAGPLMRVLAGAETQPEADAIRALGVHPSTAGRFLRRYFGTTLQAVLRARRVAAALGALRGGTTSARAVALSGFESESGLRKAVHELYGVTPAEAARLRCAPIAAAWLETPLGPMVALAADNGVCLLEFADRRMLATQLRRVRLRLRRPIAPREHQHLVTLRRELAEYFAGRRTTFDTPLCPVGTPFQQVVWAELGRVPPGRTASYADIARRIGRPAAVRAVARANGDNGLAILVPCHRVIGADGALVGYGGGLWRKRRLLELERAATARPRSAAP